MLAKVRQFWNKPLSAPQRLAVVVGSVLFWQVIKTLFPVQTSAFVDIFWLPLVLVLAVMVIWGAYRRWQHDYAQPPRRE